MMIKSKLPKRKFAILGFLVLLLALSSVTPVFAQDVGLGHGFYGTVEIGDEGAEIGSVISAQIDGTECGSCQVATLGQYALIVQGVIDGGATITIDFYINGQPADQAFLFHDGWTTELNLSVTSVTIYYTLTVASDPAEGGSVTLDPSQPAEGYEANTSVELTATPAEGYTFGSWSGDLTGSTNPDTITMDSDKSVTAKFVEFSAPANVDVTVADPGVDSVDVTTKDLSEVDITNMPEGVEAQEAYVVEAAGTGSFTLRFTDIANASDIKVYKVADTTWTELTVTVIDATTVEVTMEAGDPILVFALPPEPGPEPTPGEGGGGGGAPVRPPLNGTIIDLRTLVAVNGVFIHNVTIYTADRLAQLIIDRGTHALTENKFPLSKISFLTMDEPPFDPPEGVIIIGQVYDLSPDGAIFSPAITLAIKYDPEDLPEGCAEKDLCISYWDGEKCCDLESTCDVEADTVSCPLSHFTIFAVIGTIPPPAPAPAAFSVSDLFILPAEVEPEEAVTIIASVVNTGGTEGTYSVVLKINEVKEAEKSVTIDAGESQDVSFSVTREELGSYSVDVDGLSGSFTVVAPPVPAPPPAPPPVKPIINWPLIGGIIAGVIVVGLLIFFLVRRRGYLTW